MTMRQFGLWNRIRGLQSKFKFAYFDGQMIADSFQGTPRSTVYKDMAVLVKEGWIKLLEPQKRKGDGTFSARKVVAVLHKEWASVYPNKCSIHSISETGEDGIHSISETDHSISETDRSISETDRSTLMDKDLVHPDDTNEQTSIQADDSSAPPSFVRRNIEMHASASKCSASSLTSGTVVTSKKALLPLEPHERAIARAILDGREKPASPYAPWRTLEWAQQLEVASVS
jgi:hypothetical protein